MTSNHSHLYGLSDLYDQYTVAIHTIAFFIDALRKSGLLTWTASQI
jgi:hypothetical protein